MQAMWKPTPNGGMKLVDVLPDGKCDNMPDGKSTASARQQAFRNIPKQVSDGRHVVAQTVGEFK